MSTLQKNRLRSLLPGAFADVDHLVDQFLGAGGPVAAWRAPAALWEADDRLHLELDAPGVGLADVEITFDKGQLSVGLERKTDDTRRYWHNERGFGKVTRTVTLPDTVEPDSIEASLKDGVLHISIAKRPEAQPKRIEVRGA